MSLWLDLLGTTKSFLRIGLAGVRLKNNAGSLDVRNAGDTADAAVTASKLNVSGDAIDLNSDAAGAGSDWTYTLQRPATGMTGAVTLTLPPTDGSPNQVLKTDGDGGLSWGDAADTSANLKIDSTPLAFDSNPTIAMFTAADGSTEVDLTAGAKTQFITHPGEPAVTGGTEDLQIAYAAGGATAGVARVQVHYATPS